jgi:hypothetical protein
MSMRKLWSMAQNSVHSQKKYSYVLGLAVKFANAEDDLCMVQSPSSVAYMFICNCASILVMAFILCKPIKNCSVLLCMRTTIGNLCMRMTDQRLVS